MTDCKRVLALLAGLSATGAQMAMAADVTIDVANLRNAAGLVHVALCPEESFTKPQCPWRASARATDPRVTVTGVPAGVYAAQAFHDENADGRLNRRMFRPLEGLGFSRDAPMRRGPPRFGDAAVRIDGDSRMTINMRYYR
ncbi:hypothetical protein OCGS_2156 [Oceaniovalibus guishaninsula JLT2003]|uniref:DUF2141 domain-containing protein n=1 Tax=Oceaniovalibus guishaninsula JLT2003 TaxID=1231392 RepID=K2HAX2_9RHOB|nr:DUF2141 domain-containing protein [Oceaniovalibus guishaninsula]EKE43822.1 hypothetical protein OCGS_2156 [Oceaniovalibus guishaninsula JLT2003]